MWKFKNRKESLEERTEPTAIIERQSVDVDLDGDFDGDGGSSSDGDKQNNENYDYNDKQSNDDSDEYSNNNNIETIDVLLAKELNALSFRQRETINEEIHGINVDQVYLDRGGKDIEETPQLLKESFGKLQTELNKLQPNSFAYQRCQQLYGDDDNIALYHGGLGNAAKRRSVYINTDNFRMMFLRCELFDITKAARRLVNFVELMFELYGDIGIQRRIRLTDMSDYEQQILKAGYSQILPGRDRAGRRIAMYIGFNATNEYTVNSRLRIVLYLNQQCFVDDIETQRKGAVIIQWYHNINIFHDMNTRRKVTSAFAKAIPIRVGAMHICILDTDSDGLEHNYTNKSPVTTINEHSSLDSNSDTNSVPSIQSTATPVNVIKSMIALSIGTKNRSKLRIHTGSAMECLYALQSFGIPSNQIPIVNGTTSNKKRRRKNKTKKNDSAVGEDSNNSNLDLNNYTRWLQLCQLKESNIQECGKEWKYYGDYDQQQIIECPKHSDILSGRGMDVMNHPGNTVLRSIVVSKLDEYMNMTSKGEKITLTLAVVHLLKNKYSARFLKEETTETHGNLGCWVEISNKEARLKIRIAFRDRIKNQQSQQKKMMQSMMTMPTAGKNMDSNNTSNNNNDTGSIASNTTAPTMNPPINLSSSTSTSLAILSRTASLILERQKSNNNNSDCLQQIKQQVEEDTDSDNNSSTSLFLNQTGSGSNCVNGGSCGIPNSTGKKRQLQTKSHLSCFDCRNSS